MLAVFPVDGKVFCGRGGRTHPGGPSKVVLYTQLVTIASRRRVDLAMGAAGLGWDHPSPGMVGTRVLPVAVGTRDTI